MAASPQRLYLRVGVLIVLGLALLVGFILFVTANRLGRSAVIYETYIEESVQGLDVGSPVRYRGVAIGRVTQIGLVSSEYRRPQGEAFISAFRLVLVRFSVDEARIGDVGSMEDAIILGLRVRLATQGITGVSYLELDFVDPERFPILQVPWQPLYPYLPAIPSTVAQVQSAAETLLERLRNVDVAALLSNVNGLVTELRDETRDGDLAQALREATALMRTLRTEAEGAQVPQTVAVLRDTLAELRALLGGPETRQALTDAAAALAEFRGAAEEARGLIGSEEVRRILADAAAATDDLRAAARRLPATIAAAETTLRNARAVSGGVQADLGPILRDLRASLANLRETTERLRRYPGQALFGAPPPTPEGQR